MRFFIFIFSLLWIALGTTIILHTSQARSRLKDIVFRVDMKIWASLAILLGLVLLVGAFAVQEVFWLALVLGLVAILKGAYFALGPVQQSESLLQWWFDRATETTIRLWGLVAFTLGVVLLSWLM